MNIFFTNATIQKMQRALCITFAVGVGTYLAFAFKIPHGYWIPLTILIIYIPPGQGNAIKRSSDRLIGTIYGLLLGFLFVKIFMYSNYHWGYLLPFIWIFTFYVYYITTEYWVLCIVIGMFIPIIMAMTSIFTEDIDSVLVSRTFCTAIAAILVLAAEFFIYRSTSKHSVRLKSNTSILFKDIAKGLEILTEHFLKKKRINNVPELIRLWERTSSFEKLYNTLIYEFEYKKNLDEFFSSIFKETIKLCRIYRELICIVNCNDIAFTEEQRNFLLKASEIIIVKLNSIVEKEEDSLKFNGEKVSRHISCLKLEYDKLSPLGIWVENLFEIATITDKLYFYINHQNTAIKKDSF